NHVGGVFALVHAPVVGDAKLPAYRTEALGHVIQSPVQPLDVQSVSDLLGTFPVGDFHQRIVQQLEVDFALAQHAGQPTVSVEVDLQSARAARSAPARSPVPTLRR